MASTRDSRGARALLLSWLVAVFLISALGDPRLLAGVGVAVAAVFHRGLARCLSRVLRSILPVSIGLSLASFLGLRAVSGTWPPVEPFAAVALRTAVIGLLTFSVLGRVRLLRALAPYPTLSRILVVSLAQIHALRLLATESRDGLRSRMARRPRAIDVVRGAGAVTGALLTLSTRNARDISDAIRSRGF